MISPGVYLFQAHLRRGGEGDLIETGCLFEKGGGPYLINKRPWYQLSIKKLEYKVEKVEDHAAEDQNQIQNSSCK